MLTSEACINKFIEDHSFKLSTYILKVYRTALSQLIEYCGKPYNDISTKDIRRWIKHLVDAGYKASSIKTKIYGLRLFYKYCVEEMLMVENPVDTVPLPKDEPKQPRYMIPDQLNKLRNLTKDDVRLRAIIEVFYATGVRLSELLNMKHEDINWEERLIRIPEGKGGIERIVPFTEVCAEYLKAYLQTRRDSLPYVFVNRYWTSPINPVSIGIWLKPYSEKIGIHLNPHLFRHTFAAHLAMKGMKFEHIQALLGHVNPKHTLVYTNLYQQVRSEMYDQFM
ncbi:tyrosine-type recombinase/integrase [Fictibacillus sp. 7GRE50]|uniref:tyrosine-type recombinase/integrase n=1 Tax=Fictibacillus sp. 7GRE50 TaxID=2745878 RepID=UPI0018CF83F0|nr:tyrosine-type recombinase/integrase [Fictibacillus sp. 7GRE50]MBH0164093.1 tyrosine-type recombinase/integrase [Fictibacillus sp. 7GRE50]